MRVVNEHSSRSHLERQLAQIQEGIHAALLTDGGTPGISDPGAILADLCYEEGIAVRAIPGPCAAVLALALSGFFAQRFAFLGFLPRKPSGIRSELARFADSPYTLVIYESPHRIDKTLATANETLGPRRYVICRELTKAYEQVWRGRLPNIPAEIDAPRKGEITIVIEGTRRSDESVMDK